MGLFSWLYSNTGKAMKVNKVKNSYLLVPPEFQEEYGKYIKEECYDGYGHMGGYDIYALVALWNRRYIPKNYKTRCLQEPELENFGGLYEFEKDELRKKGYLEEEIKVADKEQKYYYYQTAKRRYEESLSCLNKFVSSEIEYDAKEDEGFLRKFGIDIACYNEDNAKLKYPIKITSRIMAYDKATASKSDPDQGL